MKINFADIDKETFNIKDYKINTNRGEETVYLVCPKDGKEVHWTDENKIFKSSVWDSKGNLISAGFRAFTNFGEQPDFEPVSHSALENIKLYEKIDGSCIIVSYWHDTLIVRTRRSIDIDSLDNANELYELLEKYDVKRKIMREACLVCKRLKDNDIYTYPYSYIFEYVSSKRDIVLHYNKSDLYLIGKINHNDYGYHPGEILDVYGETYNWNRPKNLTNLMIDCHINNIDTLAKSIRDNYDHIEGAVANIMVDNRLILKKMKTEWYLNSHYLYLKFRSTKYLLNYIIDNNLIIYNLEDSKEEWSIKEIYFILDKIEKEFDYELTQLVKHKLDEILDLIWDNHIIYYHEAERYIQGDSWKEKTHKEIALEIKDYHSVTKSMIWNFIKKSPFDKKVKIKI